MLSDVRRFLRQTILLARCINILGKFHRKTFKIGFVQKYNLLLEVITNRVSSELEIFSIVYRSADLHVRMKVRPYSLVQTELLTNIFD